MHRTLCCALLLILAVVTQAGATGPLASSLTSTSHTASTWSNDNTISVTWSNPGHSNDYGNVVGYAIAWNTSASYVPAATINLDAAATSTTSNAVADGQNIYFHIRVLYDEFSPYQADALGPFWIDTTPPSAVSGLSITRGDGQLTLGWTNPGETDFAGVVITRDTSTYPASASSGTLTTMTASQSFTAGGSGTYVDTSVTNGTTYYYSVFAYDQRGGESTRNYSTAAQANGSPTGSSSAPPQVSSNSPASSATDVPITSTITVSFGKDMNASTITTSTITVAAGQTAVVGSISYSNKTATFTPTSNLDYNTQYTVTVLSGSSGVKDSQGNGLDGNKNGTAEDAPTDNHSFTFTTAQATPPKVNSTTPTSGATEVEPNSAITVVFSKDMNPSTITSSTITVAQGSTLSTTVSYNALDKTATITPASWLTGGSTATVTVVGGSSGVKDENGLALDSNGDGSLDGSDGNYTFTFTVKNTPIISLSSTALNFGSTTSGSTKDLSVTVTNSGAASLHMGTASITSTTYYTSTADSCSGLTIAASGGTCSITVHFAPTTTGSLSTTLIIPSDSGRTDLQTSTNRTVTLSGTGVAASTASIGLSTSSIEFGSVIVGQNSSTQNITVTSNGAGLALSIGAVSLQGGGSSHFQITAETCSTSSPVAVDGTCTVTVRFSPTSSGSKSDILRITSNSGRTDTTISTTSTVNLYGTASSQSATISLASGWNLISLPYTPSDTAISSVLAGIDGYYTIVWGYPSQEWKFYDPSWPAGSNLATLEAGKGYWIRMTSARTLTVSGTTPSTSISLASGWNLVGYNRTTSGDASSVLAGIDGHYTIVWGYPSQEWKFYDPSWPAGSNLATLEAGKGYWIKTTGAVTWTLP